MKKIIDNAPAAVAKFKQFCDGACQLQPSQAHCAVAEIARTKQCAVFTENIDVAHQKSGIQPIMADPRLREQGSYFKDIDAIVCVGLSHDDRGLLAFYKQHNPAGVIIAIDLKQPNYLGQEDMLVTGNLQEIVPSLAKKIT
jgi:NAD-dependent SIR2 family protein deacetylase